MQKQARRAFGLTALLFLGAFGPCGTSGQPQRPAPTEGERPSRGTTPVAVAAPEADATPKAEDAAPREQGALRFVEIPRVSPVTASLLAHVREVSARDPDLFDGRVAKLGGSSVESRAFLHCFDSDEVDLAGRDELAPTLEAFRRPASGARSFSRDSLATKVGWSIRHGMSGRPPYVHREISALRPRWALAFFGNNDVQGKNDQRFAQRLDDLVNELERRGVVPVLATLAPRGRDRRMNEWTDRYNRVVWGIATARSLPVIDFHAAHLPLPGFGLAGDGVHPNVYVRRANGYGCDFTEEGLAHGYNQRNLLVLETLHALRTAYLGEAEPVADPAPLVGSGSPDAPVELATAPFAHRVAMPEGAPSRLGDYTGCGPDAEAAGSENVYRVRVDAPTRVSVTSYGFGGVAGQVYLLGADPTAEGCVSFLGEEGEAILAPGVHHLVLEAAYDRRAHQGSSERSALLVVTAAPVEAAQASSAVPGG